MSERDKSVEYNVLKASRGENPWTEPSTSASASRDGLEHGNPPPSQEQHGIGHGSAPGQPSGSEPVTHEGTDAARRCSTPSASAPDGPKELSAGPHVVISCPKCGDVLIGAAPLQVTRPPAIDGQAWTLREILEEALEYEIESNSRSKSPPMWAQQARAALAAAPPAQGSAEEYNPEMVERLKRLEAEGPEATFDSGEEMLAWLNSPAQGSAGWRDGVKAAATVVFEHRWMNLDVATKIHAAIRALAPPVEAQGSEKEALIRQLLTPYIQRGTDTYYQAEHIISQVVAAALGDSSPAMDK